MKNIYDCIFILLVIVSNAFGQSKHQEFELFTKQERVSIVYDKNGSSLDSISAYLLAEDIFRVTSYRPLVTTDKNKPKGNLIAIGEIDSDFISELIKPMPLPKNFKHQKESFHLRLVSNALSAGKTTLVIAGTDPRGTAYGTFYLSEKIGVSPWYWWADVPVKKQDQLVIEQPDHFSKEPSVEFRGIFLNDEDWGLQPWAKHTFEPDLGDIGPKTYSKIFELLLRLKANTIWPAMHPSTKAFFHYPGNPEMAKAYQIVIGSSHAEPMLRNNVDEWDKKKMGAFNYLSNQEKVNEYWETRVKEAKDQDAIYTLGMRGIHDSGMEGVSGIEEATNNLQKVITNQRALLKKHNSLALKDIPQVFTVYKEVLDIYDYGLQLPEDISIMWTDDNYGYIRRLGNEEEQSRKGGSGVYYHASYWGRPHDYQWLSTTHPALIREEMIKAYHANSKKIWILNVGDLKPAEYNIQFFLDMAYDIEKFKAPDYVQEHNKDFYTSIFGKDIGKRMSDIKLQYYDLAFERKPEFMGWSQTEPTTEIDTTAYTSFSWGDELSKRIEKYNQLEEQVDKVQTQIDVPSHDAFFQLVYYPVKGASFMNKKFLYRDLALKYSKQNRLVAKAKKKLSHSYHDSIRYITHQYNDEIAEGKWKGMMDMAPRELPVFDKPDISIDFKNSSELVEIAVENHSEEKKLELPTFYQNSSKTHFFDIYLKKPSKVNWSIDKIPNWLKLNRTKGKLNESDNAQQRVRVEMDWLKWQQAKMPKQSHFFVNWGNQKEKIELKIYSYEVPSTEKPLFTEQNGIVSIYAEHPSEQENQGSHKWQKIPGLGYSGNLMQASPTVGKPLDTLDIETDSPFLQYDIYTKSSSDSAELVLSALPTHPLTSEHKMRIGVQWNDEAITIVDFKTIGRSEVWKQNVLRNLAKASLPLQIKTNGKQSLKIYMIDQGVALDFIYINLNGQDLAYSLLPETRLKK